jgi:hypothetical protein
MVSVHYPDEVIIRCSMFICGLLQLLAATSGHDAREKPLEASTTTDLFPWFRIPHFWWETHMVVNVGVIVNNKRQKVKLSLCLTKHHAMKAYWGRGGIASRIIDLGTRWRWVVSFTPRPLYPQGKLPWYPLDRRLDEPQNRSGHGGEEKNSQPPTGNRTLEPKSSSPAPSAIPTELSRLLNVNNNNEKNGSK